MTSDNLRIKAQLLTGFTIDTNTSFTHVKTAIGFIARNYPLACPKKTVTATISDDWGTYQISEELVRLDRVTYSDSHKALTSEDYECDERGLLTFREAGTYSVTYRYVVSMPQTVSDDINLPDKYVEPIMYYIAARMRARLYGDSDSDAQNFESQYQAYLENADITSQRTNRRFRRLPVRV